MPCLDLAKGVERVKVGSSIGVEYGRQFNICELLFANDRSVVDQNIFGSMYANSSAVICIRMTIVNDDILAFSSCQQYLATIVDATIVTPDETWIVDTSWSDS
jgi:hypothetical protein